MEPTYLGEPPIRPVIREVIDYMERLLSDRVWISAVELQGATEGTGVLSKGTAIVGNPRSPLFTGRIGCWRSARDLRKTFRLPGAEALTTSVPRLPVFAADFAQHATDGGHDLIR